MKIRFPPKCWICEEVMESKGNGDWECPWCGNKVNDEEGKRG